MRRRTTPTLFFPSLLTLPLLFCQACHSGSSSSDPLDTPEPASVELHGIPSAAAIPPVVPEARGHISVQNVTGPQNAHVAWNVGLPFTSMPALIQEIGIDNTVYVNGYDGVGAVRDGKLQWAYKVSAPEEFGLSNDGDLWFTKSGTGQYFVLNRNGQGGLLPRAFRQPIEAVHSLGTGCSGNGRWVRGGAIQGDIGLDYECTRPQAITGPDGLIYVGTDAPDIRAYNANKTLVWKLQAPCAAQTLIIGPNSRVVFSCKDNSIHMIDHGALKWTQPGDGEIAEPNNNPPSSSLLGVMDSQGTLYFIDRPAGSAAMHIHALSSTGKMLWTIESALFIPNSMAFDKNGHIYLSGERGTAQHLISITD